MRQLHPAAAAAALALGLAACTSIPDAKWPVMASEQPGNMDLRDPIRIIQIDEGKAGQDGSSDVGGEFFDEPDYSHLKEWLDASPDSPIVVFVHGWHHNASGKKKNLPQFREFIEAFHSDLCDLARIRNQPNRCAPVQGVFVGWRGDGLDPLLLPDILDFPTFDARKRASARVGTGKLRTLLLEMEKRYRNRHVVFAGHSLGANAMYHAVSGQEGFQVEDLHEYLFLNPATTSEEFRPLFDQIERRADFELSQLGAQSDSSLQAVSTRILRREHRKVMVLQADRDFVVGKLFRWRYGEPIGFDVSRTTHRARAKTLASCPRLTGTQVESYCKIELESGLTLWPADGSTNEPQCKAAFSRPVWIVSADRSVSKSHGDVWNREQRCALAELVANRILQVPGY